MKKVTDLKLSTGSDKAFNSWTVPAHGSPVNRPMGMGSEADVPLDKTGSFSGVPGFTVKPQG